MPSDLSRSPDYFAARAAEERRLAMASKDPKIRAIHLDLAEKYDAVASATSDLPPAQPADDQLRA